MCVLERCIFQVLLHSLLCRSFQFILVDKSKFSAGWKFLSFAGKRVMFSIDFDLCNGYFVTIILVIKIKMALYRYPGVCNLKFPIKKKSRH